MSKQGMRHETKVYSISQQVNNKQQTEGEKEGKRGRLGKNKSALKMRVAKRKGAKLGENGGTCGAVCLANA